MKFSLVFALAVLISCFSFINCLGKRDEALRFMGLKSTDETDVIRARYKKLSLKYHPDKGGSTEQMQELNMHFTVLLNKDVDQAPKIQFQTSLSRDVDTYAIISVKIEALLSCEKVSFNVKTAENRPTPIEVPSVDFFHPFKSRIVLLGEGHILVPNPSDFVITLNVKQSVIGNLVIGFNAFREFVISMKPPSFYICTAFGFSLAQSPLIGLEITCNNSLKDMTTKVDLQRVPCNNVADTIGNCYELTSTLAKRFAGDRIFPALVIRFI